MPKNEKNAFFKKSFHTSPHTSTSHLNASVIFPFHTSGDNAGDTQPFNRLCIDPVLAHFWSIMSLSLSIFPYLFLAHFWTSSLVFHPFFGPNFTRRFGPFLIHFYSISLNGLATKKERKLSSSSWKKIKNCCFHFWGVTTTRAIPLIYYILSRTPRKNRPHFQAKNCSLMHDEFS